MDFPLVIQQSQLYSVIASDAELLASLSLLRANAIRLAATIDRTVPRFTDHSIRHMDALWGVTGRVLTNDEINTLSPAEGFILASGFYLHDIGMAYAATDEGIKSLKESKPWLGYLASMPTEQQLSEDVQAAALSVAVRSIHASAAIELATGSIPGTDIYLIEPKQIRDAWGMDCGRIAASHHWSLEKLDHEFGRLQSVSLPGGRSGDLGLIACILRIVDYAHINRDRAPTIDRVLRQLPSDSLVHWLAQENVDGPDRNGNSLEYRSSRKVADVDAWWLYYDLLRGLDAEIRAVKRYLDRRTSSCNRFSLEGVRGAESPEAAAISIPTSGFLPIEVNVRAGSISKLVQLLAGESLYGPDPLAAVRELIQNARDAVGLKAAITTSEYEKAALNLPIEISLRSGEQPVLEIIDYGVGMSQKVISDFLIAIASDYWSSQFYIDFPNAAGYKPAGKFGIGFLSVFMLGDTVVVESNRAGEARHSLTLSGLGRRGELRSIGVVPGSGTKVSIKLKPRVLESLGKLGEMVRIYAPALNHPIKVTVDGETTNISRGWFSSVSPNEFHNWVNNALTRLGENRSPISKIDDIHDRYLHYRRGRIRYGGDDFAPSWDIWPEYRNDNVRLLASTTGESLLCLKGLALQAIRTYGFSGVIDVDNVTPDASRRQALDADVSMIMEQAREAIRPMIVEHLDSLGRNEFLITQLDHLCFCVRAYGAQCLKESSVPWVSLLKVPGDLRQVSCRELLTTLSGKQSVFFAYNTGPWTAIKKWSASKDRTQDELIIVLDGDHESDRPG